ncbi:TadE/TadG family type IV pilus assembly protein [Paraburkholderia sp. A1BS-2L]|uniref:TadE/TadG family type IV pilus assembly protein n=1 Tax=Paraburkholderia sp. A1BS-2L TaxID=3028373 RepID=UPI003DA924B5
MVSSGAYRVMRHPMYSGYFVTDIGFSLVNFGMQNIIVYLVQFALQAARIVRGQGPLSDDAQYREYKEIVRYSWFRGYSERFRAELSGDSVRIEFISRYNQVRSTARSLRVVFTGRSTMTNCQKRGYRRRVPAIRLKESQKGVAAVEFAIVLPVLLLILFGIVELGIGLYDKAVITNASREGARAGVVLKTPKPSSDDVKGVVTRYTSNYLMTFGQQNTPAVTTTGTGGTFGQPLSVTVTYQYNGLGLGQILSAITGPITLSATTVMNNE